MQMAFYFNQSRCSGCQACVLACWQWHSEQEDVIHRIRVSQIEHGKFPNPSVKWLALPCLHCTEASCIEACPADAIYKRAEDGVVLVDADKCLGKDSCGGLCLEMCPYDTPRFGVESNPKMQKCDFCMDRLAEDKKPICVAACPLRALDSGPLDEMKAKYGEVTEVDGFTYSPKLKPSIVFKPKATT